MDESIYSDSLGGPSSFPGSTGQAEINPTELLEWIQFTNKRIEKQRTLLKDYERKTVEHEKNIKKQQNEMGKLKDDIENQKNRIPEIVGLFSAIIALVLIDISIIKSVPNFLSAILLISALTCSMAIFAILIHSFFSANKRNESSRYFWIPFTILSLLVVAGIFTHVIWGIDLYDFNQQTKYNRINIINDLEI